MKFDFKALIDKIVNSAVSNLLKRPKKRDEVEGFLQYPFLGFFFRERNFCSTRKGLRVGTGFREFLQTS